MTNHLLVGSCVFYLHYHGLPEALNLWQLWVCIEPGEAV